VDGAAHQGAVDAQAPTLAVLGCGVDHAYPLAHLDLRDALLAAGGGLLSEHPPGVEPRKHHFPRRNRIAAALVQALVVVEAPARSGALITARLALDLGREILAVPGAVGTRGTAGTHRLLREGAGLCEGAVDVLHALGIDDPDGPRLALRAEPEGAAGVVWRALDAAASLDAATLCARTGLAPEVVTALLVELELGGRARRGHDGGFLRAP
jgi:DNA processing protein